MQVDGRPYPDHYAFRPMDLARFGPTPVLMTEKDAVKCERFAGGNCWYVPVSLDTHPAFTHRLDRLVTGLREDG
jgi:tetraacyldisaccharide 4'-kinase